jgi:hypothetical protein
MAWANGWLPHGPVMGCHVAVGKCPMRARNQFSKIKKGAHQIWRRSRQIWWPNYKSNKSKQQLQTWRSSKPHIYIYIYNYNPKGEARGLDPGTSPYPNALTIASTNHWANRLHWLVHPTFLLNVEFSHRMGGGHSTVRPGMIFETKYRELIAGCRHKNRDEISQGPGSARVRLRHGDNHFWVIRRHKFNGVVCFLI